MTTPARFPNGVTNVLKSSTLGMFGANDPTKFHTFFDDFDKYTATDWTITTTEAGAGDATEALTALDGGCLLITNDAADNDLDFFQKPTESYLVETGKRAWFKAKFKVSDATQSDIIMGLQITDTTPLAVSDGIFFMKNDGDTKIHFVTQKAATPVANVNDIDLSAISSLGTLADDTFITLGWYYDGAGNTEVYINDNKVYTFVDVSATYLPDHTVTPSFGIQNGEAVAKTMTIDYIFTSKER